MSGTTPTELERFHDFIGEKLANGGAMLSPEEALRQFRADQQSSGARTPLGKKLRELRSKIVADRQPLLSLDELDREIAERRGERILGERS